MINTVIQRDSAGQIVSIFQWADTRGTWRMVESFKRFARRPLEHTCNGCGMPDMPGNVDDCAGDHSHIVRPIAVVGFFSRPDVGHTVTWTQSRTEDLEDAIDNGRLVSRFAVSTFGRIIYLA